MDTPKTCVLTGKSLKISDAEKSLLASSLNQTIQWNTRPLNTSNEEGPSKQYELN